MGKRSLSKSKGDPSGGGSGTSWGSDRHAEREAANVASHERRRCRKNKRAKHGGVDDDDDGGALQYKRTALSHDNADRIDLVKLRLHIVKAKRAVDSERERLRSWDGVEEKRKRVEEEKRRAEAEAEAEAAAAANGHHTKKKRRGRAGPETWKLRGAARPAWEVYDFDTRYVDPHLKEHEEARARAGRVRNLLSVYRGRFGEEGAVTTDGGGGGDDCNGDEDFPPQPHCRRFLSLLMQLGHLNVEAKKFKAAREAFLEAMELEGTAPNSTVVTTVRSRLMRMYMEANRPDSARRLWERLLPHDKSAWVRYSAALVEFVSWHILGEDGSTRRTANALLCSAVSANPFCALSIAFHGTFGRVVEYGDEVEDADPETLEEAIEYCHSEQMGSWLGTDGAVEWVRAVVLRLLNGRTIDLDDDEGRAEEEQSAAAGARLGSWEAMLSRTEEEFEASQQQMMTTEEIDDGEEGDGDNRGEEEEDDERPDVLMFAGMFRTAMDMLSDAGELLKVEDEIKSEDEAEEETRQD